MASCIILMTMLLPSLLLVYCGTTITGLALTNELIRITQCTCPGFNVTYECTVAGEVGATIWTGTAIDCQETSEITFIHQRRFTDIRGCNNGAIIGRGIRIESSFFTSQLNITVESNMEGETVECIYNDGMDTSLIGNSTISITSASFPPPHNVTVIVVDINPLKLIFEWSPVSLNCPALHYIISFNCGICPPVTTNTTALCTGIELGMSNCTFTIQTSVCDSPTGDMIRIPLVLKVPSAPVINVIPLYTHSIRILFSLKVEVYKVEQFFVADGLDGSPVNHTITYTNAATGTTCDSSNIPLSSCVNGVCRHAFNMSEIANCQDSLSADSSDLIVSVLSTNVLGNGPSNNVIIGFMNTKVEVTFNSDITRAICKFFQFQVDNTYSISLYYCGISYEPINSDHNRQQRIFGTSQNDTVVVNFPHGIPPGSYRFTVNATDGLNTTLIEGTFNKRESESQFTVSGLVFGVSIGAMGLLILIITVVLTTMLIQSRKQASKRITTGNCHTLNERSFQPTNAPEQSPTAIDTERNVAYISLADARQSVQALHT